MKRYFSTVIVAFLFLSGCAVKVVPQPVESGIVNPSDNSQTIAKNGISITAKSADPELSTYNLEGNVASFSVMIDNQTDKEVSFTPDSFVLLDEAGLQYTGLSPEKVKEIITRDSYYLIPYPYVGFYYLEDYEKNSAVNTFSSQLPYYYEMYPQDIFTKSLAAGSIIPKAKVAGLVYFKIDLYSKKLVKLLVYRKETAKSQPADYIFPFRIER